MRNAASELGKLSWAKRKKQFKTKKHLSAIGALGAAKTNEIKRLKRAALDKTAVPNRTA
jgi:hypothetical protein